MKLADLNPEWWGPAGRSGVALLMDCPCAKCRTVKQRRLLISVDPPLDGGPAIVMDGMKTHRAIEAGELPEGVCIVGSEIAWKRTGDTFDTLSLSPSVDASRSGDWHGFITNGQVS